MKIKGGIIMIMFMILLLTLLTLTAITIIGISIGGSVFIVVFGDVIVCIAIIIWIIKRLFRKKK